MRKRAKCERNHSCGSLLLQLRARSEDDADDELLSVAVVKSGNKVVTGSQMGVLNLYSWGYFNDCSDRFPGVPLSTHVSTAIRCIMVVWQLHEGDLHQCWLWPLP